MSSATSRPTVKAMDDQSEVSNLVFPPLMSTIDTYIDASSDLRYAQAVEKVDRTPAKKKGGGRKAAKKKQISHNLTPLEMDHHSSSRQPESLQAQSLDNLKEQYHLRRYSSSEREDYAFGSVSLESAPKGNGSGDPAAVRMAFVSSPPLTERRPAGSKNSFPPRSPARVIVQSPNVGAYAYSNVAHSSPTDVSALCHIFRHISSCH